MTKRFCDRCQVSDNTIYTTTIDVSAQTTASRPDLCSTCQASAVAVWQTFMKLQDPVVLVEGEVVAKEQTKTVSVLAQGVTL